MYDIIYNVIIIIKLNYGWLCIYLSTNTKKKKTMQVKNLLVLLQCYIENRIEILKYA